MTNNTDYRSPSLIKGDAPAYRDNVEDAHAMTIVAYEDPEFADDQGRWSTKVFDEITLRRFDYGSNPITGGGVVIWARNRELANRIWHNLYTRGLVK